MAIGAFTLPQHWEDWLDVALGIWLCASPWVLQFAGDMTVVQNAFIVGVLLILTETVILFAFRVWEEWANVVLGAWLVISPWLLGITALVPSMNFVITGVLVLALAFYEMWDTRWHTPRPA
jgi:hypothetical protein